jgi:MoaA/NifB/PqqE/SkfB family radical SAM enzyme
MGEDEFVVRHFGRKMDELNRPYEQYIPPRLWTSSWKVHPLDGKLLLFNRQSGINILIEGDETKHFQRIAPRTLQIALTNFCNLTCSFCYREKSSNSLWRYDTLLKFCQEAGTWGVLEVAFGGGEPMIFPKFEELLCELYDTTDLCVNFTTNGTLLNESFLHVIGERYGQIRLSIYEDNNWQETIKLLVRYGSRFGVNWLITPVEVKNFEDKFRNLLSFGIRDFLLLSYKGDNRSLHLSHQDYLKFEYLIRSIYGLYGESVTIKFDVCWGNTLSSVPRLFSFNDCGAGDDLISITSDFKIQPCSFHNITVPFHTIDDVRNYWQSQRKARQVALIAGCARLNHRGLNIQGEPQYAYMDLARV